MTFGELLANLLGWLGDFVRWVFGWVPRYFIVHCNELGVKYPRGLDALELRPGVHWYCPNLDKVIKHWASVSILRVPSVPLETSDGVKCEIGLTVTYQMEDVIAWEVENYDTVDSMDEVAQGELANIVNTHSWRDLCAKIEDNSILGKRLIRRMDGALRHFGVRVLSVRPSGQVRLGGGVLRVFGINLNVDVGEKPTPG